MVERLTDRDIDALQAALDALPETLEPLDVSSLDGFLAAVVVQPGRIARERWLPFVLDADLAPRAAPAGAVVDAIATLAGRREAELRRAVDARRWFDPWLLAADGDAGGAAADALADAPDFESPSQLVLPWVAGFALGFDAFPALRDQGGADVVEALALVYRHLDADDLEDADELLAAIDDLEPAATVVDAVDDLVRATLLLADASAALAPKPHPRRRHRRG